jgi:hypothetical protein
MKKAGTEAAIAADELTHIVASQKICVAEGSHGTQQEDRHQSPTKGAEEVDGNSQSGQGTGGGDRQTLSRLQLPGGKGAATTAERRALTLSRLQLPGGKGAATTAERRALGR